MNFVMKTLRVIAFHLLYNFRGLIRSIVKFICGLSVIGALMQPMLHWYAAAQINYKLMFIFIGWAIITKAFLWNYDKLILKLKPSWIKLILFE